MDRFLQFSVWLISLGASIEWGNGWWIAGVVIIGVFLIAFHWLRSRKEKTPEFLREDDLPPVAVPDVPAIAPGPFLRDEALEQQFLQLETQCRNAVTYFITLGTLLVLLGFIVLLTKYRSGGLMTCGVLGTCIAGALKLQFFLRSKRMNSLYPEVEQRIEDRLRKNPRPPLNLKNGDELAAFCSYYESIYEARAACFLARMIKIDRMVYPQDSFLLICGKEYLRDRDWIRDHFDVESVGVTLQDVVREISRGFIRKIRPEDLPPAMEAPEPPPLSGQVMEAWDFIRKEEWEKVDEEVFLAEIEKRPPMTVRLFCSCWKTREEAAIALVLRNLCILYAASERPESMMCYPDDPFALLAYSSLLLDDYVEFIMDIEKTFGIRIEREDAGRFFEYSFSGIVHLIQEKQKNRTDGKKK